MDSTVNPTWDDLIKYKTINENSLVFDVGGYLGDWTDIIVKKYNCNVFVFEPVVKFYDIIVERFKDNKKVSVFNFGLSNTTDTLTINSDNDSSSLHTKGNEYQLIKVVNINDFILTNNLSKIDLIKINIEGEEYNLLEHILRCGTIKTFDNLLIQFHKYPADYAPRRSLIQSALKRTHKQTINYEMIFENWEFVNDKHTIVCLGDSHTSVFNPHNELNETNEWYTNDNIKVRSVGPWLAYRLIDFYRFKELMILLNKNDRLILSFGEIDCRAQVNRRLKDNIPWENVIEEILDNYFHCIKVLISQKIFVGVLFTPPPLMDKPFDEYYSLNPTVIDAPSGSYEDRLKFSKYFNKRLKEECDKLLIPFITMYDEILESDDLSFYFKDDIHLEPQKVSTKIISEINKYF